MAEPKPVGEIAAAELENLKDNSSTEPTPAEHGGARPGAGRPKGSENEDTKKSRLALAHFKERVHKAADRLFNSQLDAALGEKFLYVTTTHTDSKGKKTRETTMVTDPETIKEYLDGEYEDNSPDADYYFISTKAANNMAIDSLLNRAFGTPQKNVDVTSKGEGILSRMDDKDLQRIAGALGEALSGNNDDEPGH